MKTITLDELEELMNGIIDDALELPLHLRPTHKEQAVMVFFAHKIAEEVRRA